MAFWIFEYENLMRDKLNLIRQKKLHRKIYIYNEQIFNGVLIFSGG